jgi:hypothetical protein
MVGKASACEEQQNWEQRKAEIADDDPRLVQLGFEVIRRDPAWWIEHFVFTSDQHDDKQRVKLFPMSRGYFHPIIHTLLRDKVLFVAKSRQMMMSWLACALVLWKARFFGHSECYVQCVNEAAANYFVQTRIKTMYENLPDWQKSKGAAFRHCGMRIPEMDSFIEGVPSGSDKARGRVPSMFVADELAFQEEGDRSVAAVLPAIAGDALFLGISTPNMKNHFYRRAFPQGKEVVERVRPIDESPMTEIRRYEGQSVLLLHYTADAMKRSAEWIEAEKARNQHGAGRGEEAWRQEYELDFEVTGRPKLYPHYDPVVHEQKVEYNKFRPIIRGWDFGFERPACVFMQENDYGQIVLLWAILGHEVEVEEFANIVLQYCRKSFKPGEHNGCEYPIEYQDFCDHAGTQRKDTGSTVKILRSQFRIHPRSRPSKPADRATLIAHRLRVRTDGKPGLVVNRDCSLLTEGFRGGFSSKPDAQGFTTGYPFKDGYYEHVHDGLGYAIENKYGVRKQSPDEDACERARRHRRKMQRMHGSASGYSAG